MNTSAKFEGRAKNLFAFQFYPTPPNKSIIDDGLSMVLYSWGDNIVLIMLLTTYNTCVLQFNCNLHQEAFL